MIFGVKNSNELPNSLIRIHLFWCRLRDVTVLARRAVSATRPSTGPAACSLATLQTTTTDDADRRQTPASKTILAYCRAS